MLVINDLRVSIEGKNILNGVNLEVRPGEIHAIMGPNGSGKSTLAYTLMGHPSYKLIDKSSRLKVELDGQNLIDKTPDERARMGLFMAFQYPVSVDGVSVLKFMKSAYEAMRCEICNKGKGLDHCSHLSVHEFKDILQKHASKLRIHDDFLNRSLNDGFSGGEKKRLEVLQLAVLNPSYAILDETDSGLDIDALKVVSKGINSVHALNKSMGILLITHYQRILRFIEPDFVHVMIDGKIVKNGGKELAVDLEKNGYKAYLSL